MNFSALSCKARRAVDWKRILARYFPAISFTKRWKLGLGRRSSVLRSYFLNSQRTLGPGRYRCLPLAGPDPTSSTWEGGPVVPPVEVGGATGIVGGEGSTPASGGSSVLGGAGGTVEPEGTLSLGFFVTRLFLRGTLPTIVLGVFLVRAVLGWFRRYGPFMEPFVVPESGVNSIFNCVYKYLRTNNVNKPNSSRLSEA